jgi:hypothetical protein
MIDPAFLVQGLQRHPCSAESLTRSVYGVRFKRHPHLASLDADITFRMAHIYVFPMEV